MMDGVAITAWACLPNGWSCDKLRLKRYECSLPGPLRLDKPVLEPQTKALMIEILRRMFMVDFWKGLSLTFRSQNPKYIYTEQYPLERPMVAERYRGAPRLNTNPETSETLCIPFNLCALPSPQTPIFVLSQ